jgi:hypothetical protein
MEISKMILIVGVTAAEIVRQCQQRLHQRYRLCIKLNCSCAHDYKGSSAVQSSNSWL